jgi:hypothetical protein
LRIGGRRWPRRRTERLTVFFEKDGKPTRIKSATFRINPKSR